MIIQKAPRRSCIASQYPCITEDPCIASQYPCITKDHLSRINIHASWKIHASRVNIHASQKIHASWVNIHASQKIMHRELIPKHCEKIFMPHRNYASWEDFMPHGKLCIARKFHASQKLIHHKKISCLAEIYASREYINAPQEIMHYQEKESCISNIYPSTSTAFFYFDKSKHQKEHKRRHQEKISLLHQHSFMLTLHEEYIEYCIANARHKLYLLNVKPIESLNVEGGN